MILKQRQLADRVIGMGRSRENLELAVKVKAIDQFTTDPHEAVPGSDLIILATPLDRYVDHLKSWGDLLEPGTILSDVGSVKGALVHQVETMIPSSVKFVGAHPIAGKEKSGVGVASPDLFYKALCILTPTDRTDPEALSVIRQMWETAGSHMVMLDPFLHDWILGAVSHLPHIAAFALINALEDLESQHQQGLNLFQYSGGGLRDTTRIAASSPEMWRDICFWNRDNVLAMIECYEQHLVRFKEVLRNNDREGLETLMHQAQKARRRLT